MNILHNIEMQSVLRCFLRDVHSQRYHRLFSVEPGDASGAQTNSHSCTFAVLQEVCKCIAPVSLLLIVICSIITPTRHFPMSKAVCAFEACGCKIISVDESKVVSLPGSAIDAFRLMRNSKQDSGANSGSDTRFLIVGDVWDFDNVGVSKDIPPSNISAIVEVEGAENATPEVYEYVYENSNWKINKCVKYLICADCDKGPIGMVCEVAEADNASNTKLVHMLSLSSVTH